MKTFRPYSNQCFLTIFSTESRLAASTCNQAKHAQTPSFSLKKKTQDYSSNFNIKKFKGYLPNMIRSRPKTFLAAQRQSTGVHQIAEKFPSSWHFEKFFARVLRHTKNHKNHYFFQNIEENDVKSQNSYRSTAPAVGILRAYPLTPFRLKYGMVSKFAANTANESDGVTKNAFFPRIILRS